MATIRLRWNPNPTAEGVTKYRVYRSLVSGSYGSEQKYGEVGAMLSPSFILQDAVMELEKSLFYFVVAAVNAKGEGAQCNEVVVDNRGTVSIIDVPSAPTGLRVEIT